MRIPVVALVAVLAIACEAQLDPTLTDIAVGDCVVDPGVSEEIEELDTVECDVPGAVRATKKFDIVGYSSFPGGPEIDAVAEEECASATIWLVPTEQSWNEADDRLVVCFEEDPYFAAVLDISLRLDEQVAEALVATDEQTGLCESGSVAACDRMVEGLGAISDASRSARDSVELESPPQHVEDWHREFVGLLVDMENTVDELITAYYGGDTTRFDRAFDEIDLLADREDELADQFDRRDFE